MCDDGNLCTITDTCMTGSCVGSDPVACPAPGPCRAQGTCSPASGFCTDPVQPDGAPCSDGNACTLGDVCQIGACVVGAAATVDDGNPCTVDSCDPVQGVVHSPAGVGSSCSDGNLCNGSEICNGAGQCDAGTPVVTDDGNLCTTDTCDPSNGTVRMSWSLATRPDEQLFE